MSEAFDELAARVESLEGGVGQYSVQELQRKLETSWQPDSRTFLLPERTAARAYCTTPFNTAAGVTFTKVTLQATTFDTGPNFDTATNYRYIAPSGGFYLTTYRVRSDANNNPQSYAGLLYRNGAAVSVGDLTTSRGAVAGDDIAAVGTDIVRLEKGDYLELFIYNLGAAAITVAAGELETFLSIVKVEINAPA